MIRIIVVCEGQTEETFVRDVLAPLFAHQQIFLSARLIPTSKGHKGGALSYPRVKRFILNCLKEDTDTLITTFFDLYALDNEFPGFLEYQKITDVQQRVTALEQAFKRDISSEYDQCALRFSPYIQPYEFEGLLFAEIDKLIQLESDWKRHFSALQAIRDSFPSPEHINNSYNTKPSARLDSILKKPSYRKTMHGALAIKSIGIDKLCEQCQHFSEWYSRLRALAC
jgi:hypothetical protein